MKNLYWKHICMEMNDGKKPILNWNSQLVYRPEPPEHEMLTIKDATELEMVINRSYVNGFIQRGVFNKRIKKFHIKNMRYWKDEEYKPGKINFPVSRETIYKPLNYNMSFKELSEKLPAEDFIRWMKDNGINTCPIMK